MYMFLYIYYCCVYKVDTNNQNIFKRNFNNFRNRNNRPHMVHDDSFNKRQSKLYSEGDLNVKGLFDGHGGSTAANIEKIENDDDSFDINNINDIHISPINPVPPPINININSHDNDSKRNDINTISSMRSGKMHINKLLHSPIHGGDGDGSTSHTHKLH